MKKTIGDAKQDHQRGIDHIGVSAVSIVHDGKGHILLMKRGPLARDEHGKWDATSGAIEFGETILEAIERELYEELRARPMNVEFLTVFDAHRKHKNSKTHWIAIAHAVQVDPKSVKLGEPGKTEQIGWFSAHELPTPLHSQFPKVHQFLIERKILR